jgi:predicted transcriptional regulator
MELDEIDIKILDYLIKSDSKLLDKDILNNCPIKIKESNKDEEISKSLKYLEKEGLINREIDETKRFKSGYLQMPYHYYFNLITEKGKIEYLKYLDNKEKEANRENRGDEI